MKPATFDMVRPESLDEALALLAEHASDAKVLAGGQSLVPVMNFRLAAPGIVIDLNRVRQLSGITADGSVVRIGAMTRQRELLESPVIGQAVPLLAKAMPHVGHVQTRSRGTIGGSLAHADPSAELPAVMVALDATFQLSRRKERRDVPAREFFVDAMTTVIEPDELLTEIVLPIALPGTHCAFDEMVRRHGDFAIVSVAAQIANDDLSVAVGGLEAVPRYCGALVSRLRNEKFDVGKLSGFIADELAAAEPLGDLQASAGYRRELARVLLHDTLKHLLAARAQS
ncbi:MAG: xanthine dehydrogenase family protein subunit M [Parvibaculaceae bacterium]